MSTIADTVKAAREGKGLSITALAEQAGVDRPTLSRIESGQLDQALKTLGVELNGGAPQTAPFHALRLDPMNPRKAPRDPEYIEALAGSIAENGVLVPLLARPGATPGIFLVPDGGCRMQALALLVARGAIKDDYPVPIVLRAVEDDDEALMLALAAGRREGINPMDEAEALLRLANRGRASVTVAAGIGRTTRYVNARIQLAQELADAGKAALREGKIALAQAEALLAAEEKGDQGEALLAIAEGALKTEADVRRFLNDKKWQRQAARERKAHEDFKKAKGGATEDKLEIPPFMRAENRQAPAKQTDLEDLAPCRPKAGGASPEAETPHPNAPNEQELALHKSVCKELAITGIGYGPMKEGGEPFVLDVWWHGTRRRITFYAAKEAPAVRKVKRK